MTVETIRMGVDCIETRAAFARAWHVPWREFVADLDPEEKRRFAPQLEKVALRRMNRRMERLHGTDTWRRRGPKRW